MENIQAEEGTEATLTEAFTFKLAKLLGGREEVFKTPAKELLKFMDMELEKEKHKHDREKAKMYINYLSNVFSQPINKKPSPKYLRAKREFEQLIKPPNNDKPKKKAKVYKWDFELNQPEERGVEYGND